jgi:two-component system sensor histidine kinase VanS
LNNDFSKFKRKIIWQVLLIAVAAPLAWLLIQNLLIDGLFQAAFAEGFVQMCQNIFDISYYDGVNMYQRLFRSNRDVWMSAGLFALLLLIFYFVLARMTRYFNEVNRGIDQLLEEPDGEIRLSSELDSIAAKLNQIKSNLEKRQQDARDAEQRKNDLVVYLAHDIKTPLTSVIGYLSLLDEAADMPEEQRQKYIGLTLEKAYRLEQLINEFFEITRFNLQSIVLNQEKINLTFMLQQMSDEFYPLLASSGKQIVVHSQENISLWGDADKLARVFNNILKNALAYSYPNTVIEICAVQQGENVEISFTNRGAPISPQNLERIFEKFFRIDASRSSHSGGAGLGLAIAKEIVKAHGGAIRAESNEQLTRFTVTLPNPAPGAPAKDVALIRKS